MAFFIARIEDSVKTNFKRVSYVEPLHPEMFLTKSVEMDFFFLFKATYGEAILDSGLVQGRSLKIEVHQWVISYYIFT